MASHMGKVLLITGLLILIPPLLCAGLLATKYFNYSSPDHALLEGDLLAFEIKAWLRPEKTYPGTRDMALSSGHEWFRVFAQAGGNLSGVRYNGYTPAMDPILYGDLQALELILRRGADPNKAQASGWATMHLAASMGDWRAVQMLAEAGGNADAATGAALTPLHLLASQEALRLRSDEKLMTAHALFEAGGKVDARDEKGRTPLHYAVASEEAPWQLVHLLLAHGADPLAADDEGKTPLGMARRKADHGDPVRNARVLLVLEAAADRSPARKEAVLARMAEEAQEPGRAAEDASSGETPEIDAHYTIYDKWPFDEAEAKRRQQKTAADVGVPVRDRIELGDGVEMELVLIPAGEFMMGSDLSPDEVEDRYGGRRQEFWHEHPRHRVRITRPFYMSATEVARRQYEAVTGEELWDGEDPKMPADDVLWGQATEFCGKLSARTGRHVRLPTEAEWEYACRAGTETAFFFGDDWEQLFQYANYCDKQCLLPHAGGKHDDGFAWQAPVGSYRPNRWGLYDMSGNVNEWCADWYDEDYYEGSPLTDPEGPAEGKFRVLRGGSYAYPPVACRSALRHRKRPSVTSGGPGFRICVSAEP